MNLTRCEKGHFFDQDKFEKCPHCETEMIIDEEYEEVINDDTIEIFKPVVGWLVAIAGPHFGQDFKLVPGRNHIGRLPSMDINLIRDNTVTRDKHADVIYDPKGNKFMVQSGNGKGICYLNSKAVIEPEALKANDILTVGMTDLLFIPCCSSKFDWTKIQKSQSLNI